ITTIICQIAHLHSQRNMLFQQLYGLFLLSLNMPKRAIEVMAKCGLCPCWTTLKDLNNRLSEGQVERARAAVQ
ncbi:hypothetical protein CONPUDRAFT_41205, partial [Coniophora puteana RWD-64-598 SS2]